MTCAFSPKQNYLLAALPDSEYQILFPDLDAVDMPLGKVLHDSGKAIDNVYFPITSIVALMYVTESGSTTEVGLVGKSGVVGVSSYMGGDSTTCRSVVQCAGRGFRLNARILKARFDKAGPLMHVFLRYTQALITQMGQTAACNRHHSLDQQICRWLLMSLDRSYGRELLMTQEVIANNLGVRREGVTETALKLQKAGLIRYARGHIEVLDRQGLEERSCECYKVVRAEYDRLLPALKGAGTPQRYLPMSSTGRVAVFT